MARLNVLADVAKKLKANVHAVDNLSPVSRVAVYIKAGSRYEPDAYPGISHFVKASAGLTTKDSSIFGIARHLEQTGATFKVTLDREYIIYRVNCLRDRLGYVLNFIDDTIHKPLFFAWELNDTVQPRLKYELQSYKKNQHLIANEAMHKAAYRGGLAHSIIIPEHQIEKIKSQHLHEYVKKNFVLERMSFTGLGVDANEFRSNIEENFSLNESPYNGVGGDTRYVGGEARIQANFPQTMVNYVVQGSPLSDLKSVTALELIKSILGGEQQKYVKYGDGPTKSLSQLFSTLSPNLQSAIINVNHSDTGLFGFSILGPNDAMKGATKAAVGHVKSVLSSLKEEDVNSAKKAAKARACILGEDHDSVFNAMCRLQAVGQTGQSSLDVLEKLTLKDVQTTASRILSGKPTIVSVGNPRYVPYLDELGSS